MTVEDISMTNLDRLNQMLKDKRLDLPAFRQTISPSLNNLKWLQTKFVRSPKCSREMKILLSMDPVMLLSDRDNETSLNYIARKERQLVEQEQRALNDAREDVQAAQCVQ